MSQTMIEKIAQRFAVGLPTSQEVHAGDYLSIRPAHCMTHDNTAAVIPKFKSMGATKVNDPNQPVYALDHDIQNTSPENLEKYAKIRRFAAEQNIAFYPAGRGIGHQVMVEEGFVLPGTFVVASDSHSNLYGGLGALGTPVVRTDAAAIWATGRTWWQVPDIVRINLTGQLRVGACGKDVIIALAGTFNQDEVLNCCLEFTGPGVAGLSIEERLTIANMTTEWGALAGVFPCDEVTKQFLLMRTAHLAKRGDANPRLTPEMIEQLDVPAADPDAWYAKEIEFDLSAVIPVVAGPNEVKKIATLPEIEPQDVRIDKAFLMSCVNGRLQDFEAAAKVIHGRRVASHVKFYIAAASDEIEEQAKKLGFWQTLVDAGAIVLPPGCGACIGLGEGTLADGEVGISATNRNFKGRMGSRDSYVYLASPAVVAASAIAGKIASPVAADLPVGRPPAADAAPPETTAPQEPSPHTCRTNPRSTGTGPAAVEILPGFPASLAGELLLVPKDNLNTDGIYGKEYTYKELPPNEMARAAMANYDPAFQQLAREGDLLVGGYNFGSGSSREQAATALKHRGLKMIIAGSFSQTYKRNAFNNGYICIECPALVEDLKAAMADNDAPTIRTAWQATVDFKSSRITVAADLRVGRSPDADAKRPAVAADLPVGRSSDSGAAKGYPFSPLGPIAQELVIKGGFEAVIRDQLNG